MNADFTRAFTGSIDGEFVLWNLVEMKPIHRMSAAGWATEGAVNADFTRALTVSQSGPIVLWDLVKGVKVREFFGRNLSE